MKIAANSFVGINYKLTDDNGAVIDSSEGQAPLNYIHGKQQIISGLEKELLGKSTGDKLSVKILAKDGYGERDDDLIQEIPRDRFEGTDNLELGMQFEVGTPEGGLIVTVVKIDNDVITVDGNHPLAGQNLNFDVEVVSVRDASKEELDALHAGCGCSSHSCGDKGHGGCDGDCH